MIYSRFMWTHMSREGETGRGGGGGEKKKGIKGGRGRPMEGGGQ